MPPATTTAPTITPADLLAWRDALPARPRRFPGGYPQRCNISTAHAAKLLGVSTPTLYRWQRVGVTEPFRVESVRARMAAALAVAAHT